MKYINHSIYILASVKQFICVGSHMVGMRMCEGERSAGICPVIEDAFSRLKTVLERFGIRTGRCRSRMEDCHLALRLYRFRDLIALCSLCKPEVFLAASGVRLKAFSSLVSFWRWMHRTFEVFYVIEVEESNNAYRIIGFVGIYKTELGQSLWLSVVVFDPKDRKRGYGQRTLQLLLSSLEEDRIVKRVCGEVLASNTASLRLLEKLGFDIFGEERGRLLLRKQLGRALETAHS
jgi:RimJ/RimL family protein N-acetyltransferase